MILGQYSPSIYFQVSSITVAIALIIMYWVNQYLGHDKPFPHQTISQVATHYPQYVIFRTATISGSVLTALGWFTNHFYLKTIAYQNVINIKKFKPQIILIIGLMGSFFLMGSTANIDTGKQNMHWHTACASSFFVTTLIAQMLNTLMFVKLMYTYNVVNKTLTYCKIIQLLLIFIQVYITSTYGILSIQDLENQVDGSLISNFIQWSMTYTILFGYIVMSLDVKNFKYVYENIKTKEEEKESILHNQNRINQ